MPALVMQEKVSPRRLVASSGSRPRGLRRSGPPPPPPPPFVSRWRSRRLQAGARCPWRRQPPVPPAPWGGCGVPKCRVCTRTFFFAQLGLGAAPGAGAARGLSEWIRAGARAGSSSSLCGEGGRSRPNAGEAGKERKWPLFKNDCAFLLAVALRACSASRFSCRCLAPR